VEKSSPCALFFSQRPSGNFPLTLGGAWEGYGLINMYEGYRHHEEWRYVLCGIGKAQDAIRARFDERFLRRESDGIALDVAFWKYERGNEVNWVGGPNEGRTKLRGGGRDWIPDSHSTHGMPYQMSCGGSPNFVLGSNCEPNIYQ